MARRYQKKTDWHWLRSITEDSLNASGNFPVSVSVDGKIEWIESGLYHDNYRFWIAAPGLSKEWQDKSLLLRLSSQKRPLRSKSESAQYLVREAQTLQALKNAAFAFETPELICMVKSHARQPVGLVENWVWGMPLPFYKNSIHADRIIPTIAAVAAAVHHLPPGKFSHLPALPDSRTHILRELEGLSPALFNEYPAAQAAREWILTRLPINRPATVLHGDLLPQNINCGENKGEWKIAVIDWEFAEIGDPAFDLAIVTRGDRKLMGINNGLKHLVNNYREAGGIDLTVSDVNIHELLLLMKWLWESAQGHRRGQTEGHGPDHYAQRVESLLRRAVKEGE
ncbi:MAG: aminoglycoside phosphotransferase family protein [Desulfobacterales bacterium]|nr:MAG: aminoglycoside phosphotransferase family protein [Desulfobacterales bacterium]